MFSARQRGRELNQRAGKSHPWAPTPEKSRCYQRKHVIQKQGGKYKKQSLGGGRQGGRELYTRGNRFFIL